jgi:NTP pyrophosphatase (non-canonical NTP hydrolase)
MSKIDISIPARIEKFEPHLRLFFDLMVYKLAVNAHKNDQDPDASPFSMLELLNGEVNELVDALTNKKQEDVTFEACDVANLAFLVHYHTQQKTKDEFDKLWRTKP